MDRPILRYLRNARLIDGTGAATIDQAGLLLRGNRIERVVRSGEGRSVPAEAEMIDLGGRTLMPGLIEAHVHLCYPRRVRGQDGLLWEQLEKTTLRAAMHAKILLQAGFTTIRDMGCRGRSAMAIRDAIEDGVIEGPRTLASGPAISTTGGMADRFASWVENYASSSIVVDGPEEVRKAVRLLLKDGADNIKLEVSGGEQSAFSDSRHATMSYEEIAMAVQEARKRDKTVAVHAQANEGIRNAVRAGVNTVEHATYLDRDTAVEMRNQGIFIVPTIACIFSFLEKGLEAGYAPEVIEEMRGNKDPWITSIRLAAEVGVKIANGGDFGNRYPHGQQALELELLVKHIGFTPMEAIVAATKTSAEALRLDDRIGTLEVGKLADLIVVDGDPSSDVSVLRDLERIQLVMKDGVIYKNTLETRVPALA